MGSFIFKRAMILYSCTLRSSYSSPVRITNVPLLTFLATFRRSYRFEADLCRPTHFLFYYQQ